MVKINILKLQFNFKKKILYKFSLKVENVCLCEICESKSQVVKIVHEGTD